MKLGFVRLMTERFDETFDFYANSMEFTATWGQKGDAYASFDTGSGMGLAIFDAKLMDNHLGLAAPNRGMIHDKMMITFDVENVDESWEKLRSKGVVCLNEPHDMAGWGIRCLHLRDPEGNLIELNQELSKEHWSEDLLEDAKKYE